MRSIQICTYLTSRGYHPHILFPVKHAGHRKFRVPKFSEVAFLKRQDTRGQEATVLIKEEALLCKAIQAYLPIPVSTAMSEAPGDHSSKVDLRVSMKVDFEVDFNSI